MSGPTLFVYGTLRDPDLLGALIAQPRTRPATAPGYTTVYVPGEVYPVLIPRHGATAPGLLLDGLTQRDLAVLDAYEGDGYRRAPITIAANTTPLTAQAYLPVAPPAPDAPLWTLEHWTIAHKPQVLTDQLAEATRLRACGPARIVTTSWPPNR